MTEQANQQNDTPKTKDEILQMSLVAREQEVMMYQINIDNYTMALERIKQLNYSEQQELDDFSKQLNNLLVSEKHEQKKAKIMLFVIKQQLMGD